MGAVAKHPGAASRSRVASWRRAGGVAGSPGAELLCGCPAFNQQARMYWTAPASGREYILGHEEAKCRVA